MIGRPGKSRRRGAKLERRVARLLRWYPAAWRATYGEEFAALLRDRIADGRGGLRLQLNVAREGIAARIDEVERRPAVASVCCTACWIPMFPQGLVPLAMLLTDVPARSWFLALYLPQPYGWLTAGAMTVLGLAMLGTGVRLFRGDAARSRRDATSG